MPDLKHDLALLEFKDPQDDQDVKDGKVSKREPLDSHAGDVTEGMPVLFAGYPLSKTSLTSHQGIIASITKDDTGLDTYLIDGTVNPGNSGCPLMSKDGNVIGVVNATSREDANLLKKNLRNAAGNFYFGGVK